MVSRRGVQGGRGQGHGSRLALSDPRPRFAGVFLRLAFEIHEVLRRKRISSRLSGSAKGASRGRVGFMRRSGGLDSIRRARCGR